MTIKHDLGLCSRLFLATAITILTCSDIPASDENAVARFGICPDNLSRVILANAIDDESGIRLEVTLNDTGKAELDSLSMREMGNIVEVVFDGVVILSARVRSRINSGRILSRRWESLEAASAFMKLLADRTLETPCGLIEEQ